MDKSQIRRWLRALAIAKILFEAEGYSTAYLEQIEGLILNLMQSSS